MQHQKCSLDLYVDFLIASQKQYSGLELSKVAPLEMSHDSVNRWLKKNKLTPKIIWKESQAMVEPKSGYLVIDDTLGINLVNMLWTDGEKIIPVDYRVYDPTRDGKTKNDHAQEMLNYAENRGFSPSYVLMDSWYSSIDNLKNINKKNWNWIAALKSNRLISLKQGIYLSVSGLDWTKKQVRKVWLKAYGFVLVSKIVFINRDITYIATNDLSLTDFETLKSPSDCRWKIETFHRGIKQCCGIERCYSTLERSQRNHILCAFLAFLKLEWERIQNGISWYEQKWSITRMATANYLANA